jgi:DNA-binding NarL/FixJ family response regulator
VGDFPRATQWCTRVSSIAERWGAQQMCGICRSAYGNVLATNGDWAAAELELTAAVGDLEAARPGMAAGGLSRLGDLRARQGRADEARALYERAGAHLRALVGLVSLALDAGDPAAAAACTELQRAGDDLGTPYMLGRARRLAGEMAAARGDGEEARRVFEDAVDLLVESAAAYETALARLELAGAFATLGRAEPAAAEARASLDAFAALGAARDVARAEAVLRDGAVERPALGELTPRELDVLRLVAQGLSDAEIAEQLVLSQHTVHRHVANVRAKLRLPSQAAAVAYAAHAGLL